MFIYHSSHCSVLLIQLSSKYDTCLFTIQVIVLCFWYNYPVSMTRAYLPFKSLFCAFDSVNNTQSLDVTRSKTLRRIRFKMFLVTWMFNKIYHVFILLLKTCTWSTFILFGLPRNTWPLIKAKQKLDCQT